MTKLWPGGALSPCRGQVALALSPVGLGFVPFTWLWTVAVLPRAQVAVLIIVWRLLPAVNAKVIGVGRLPPGGVPKQRFPRTQHGSWTAIPVCFTWEAADATCVLSCVACAGVPADATCVLSCVACAGVPAGASVADVGELGVGVVGKASVVPAPLCRDRGADGGGGGGDGGGGAEVDIVFVGWCCCCCCCILGVVWQRPSSSAGSARTRTQRENCSQSWRNTQSENCSQSWRNTQSENCSQSWRNTQSENCSQSWRKTQS